MKNKAYPLYPVPEIETVRELISAGVGNHPDKPAFGYRQGEQVLEKTFREFAADVNALGTYFFETGLSGGAKIAVMGENSYLWIVTYMAAVCGGNIIVPLDKELNEEEVRNTIASSEAVAVVYADAHANLFGKISEKKSTIKTLLNMRYDVPGAISKGKNLIAEGHMDYINHTIDLDETCVIIYTSGTTGLAKGVMLSHRSLMSTVVQSHRLALINGPTVLLLPLHHTYSMAGSVFSPMLHGQMCFINDTLKNVLRDIQTAKPQFICVVPLYVESFCKRIWDNARKQDKEKLLRKLVSVSNKSLKIGIDLRRILFKSVLNAFGGNLELIVSGGAPLDKQYYQEFHNFGIHIIEGYGITECSPIVSLNRNHHWKEGSVGLPCPNCEVEIFDVDSQTGFGEICVRGDIVMNGYYNAPEATAEAMCDGWFRTGDIGYIDDDGFIYTTGRKKNLIIRANGKNVHPEELEEKIKLIPEVGEVLVTGDKKSIVASIYIDPDIEKSRATEKAVQKQIKEINKDLPMWKRINNIEFRDDEFVKTTTKKIKRGQAVNANAGSNSTWHEVEAEEDT
ncbi:MAG: AMP-binding protein [Oscillospiraceae bacterium]|nr:AMP-binding protein [Oscillospiraceae bacterium]